MCPKWLLIFHLHISAFIFTVTEFNIHIQQQAFCQIDQLSTSVHRTTLYLSESEILDRLSWNGMDRWQWHACLGVWMNG
ncbi:hypothetical protein Sjap_001086 [Stephania japonica]|uniref:Uncharacterized protein n=1 Tax=Stephania japonica TaxID=461633 RepID=A0AAP0KJB1_9MAGN